jgi:hypothetical protein
MPSPRRENGDVLRCGDRSAAVVEIRAALSALGLLDNPDEDLITGRHVSLCARSSSIADCLWTALSARPLTGR